MMDRLTSLLLAAVVGLALTPGAVSAQAESEEADETLSTLEGVYTDEQATEGEQVFRQTCTACHAPGYFTAASFQRAWSGRSIYWLFRTIRNTMPQDNPGSLTPDQTAKILAYILAESGYPTGSSPLPHDDGPLRLIVLDTPEDGQDRR